MADHTWLDELKSALFLTGTSQDTLLNEVLATVEAGIESFTHLTIFDPGADVTEYHDGTGTRYLYLDQAPIKSITSIYIDATRQWGASDLLDATSYLADTGKRSGEVRLVYSQTASIAWSTFWEGSDNVQVIYRPGWAAGSEPADIRRAGILWSAFAFKRFESKTHDVRAKNMADGSVTFLEAKPPPEVEMLLLPWVRMSVG